MLDRAAAKPEPASQTLGPAHRRRTRRSDELRVGRQPVDARRDPAEQLAVAVNRRRRRIQGPQATKHLAIGRDDDLERDDLGAIERDAVGDVEIGKAPLHLGGDPALGGRADSVGGRPRGAQIDPLQGSTRS